MKFDKYNYPDSKLREIYTALLEPRLIEDKMLILLRQGKISKWFSGIGQEAIAVGATLALEEQDFVLPLHRNLGVFTARNVPFKKLFAQWQGKRSGFTNGRDRSFHFGAPEFRIIGMISHLGAMAGVADGLGLASNLSGERGVSLCFSGEGGTSEGDMHEAMNVAAVWNLPVIFLIENNGYGLSTPSHDQYACEHLADRAKGYGMKSKIIEGNNVLEVYHTVSQIANEMRENPAPFLLECKTFRMRGHEEASGVHYVPGHHFEEWGKKDPIRLFEAYLIEKQVYNANDIESLKNTLSAKIDSNVREVFSEPEIEADFTRELLDVYAPIGEQEFTEPQGAKEELRLVDAISQGLKQSLEKHKNLVVMGQDIAEYGGVFKVTEGFVDRFGKDRIRNTPICESAIVGAALGLSLGGYKSVVEMQFADFVSCAFNQIVNNLAKTHYRWNHAVDVTIRMPTGAGVGAGPFHSQSTESWFFHVPGLKIVYPAFPSDAKGLLMASIDDPNPVLFFEHKKLYRSVREEVPKEPFSLPIGKARVVLKGSDATIITYGWGVHWAMDLVKETGYPVEVVDLRSLLPWDQETVRNSVIKCGKALILHEDTLTGGIGAEISSWIVENCFEHLDAPVIRVGGLDTPIPLAPALESDFLPVERLKFSLEKLLNY